MEQKHTRLIGSASWSDNDLRKILIHSIQASWYILLGAIHVTYFENWNSE